MARKPDIRYIQFYTDGSAAREMQMPAPRKKKTRAPAVRKQKMRVFRVDPLAWGGIVVSVVMLVLLIIGCVQLNNVENENARMQGYIADLATDRAELQHTYQSSYELAAVEEAALAMGMIPAEEATTITIQLPPDVQEDSTSAWEDVYAFLAGLFA